MFRTVLTAAVIALSATSAHALTYDNSEGCHVIMGNVVAEGAKLVHADPTSTTMLVFDKARSARAVAYLNLMPPIHAPYVADRVVAILHQKDNSSTLVLSDKGCVTNVFTAPYAAWANLVRDAFGLN